MKPVETVLILGARAPVALDLCRSFALAGWKVILADSLRFPISRWSRCAKKFIRLPSPVYNPEEFKKSMLSLIEDFGVNLCIPTCEEVFHISLIKDQLPTRVFVDDIKLMDRLHNKWTFSQESISHFSVPKTCLVKDFRDWEHTEEYVFKPIYSRFGAETLLNKPADVVQDKILDSDLWIAQKKIIGEEVCVYSIWNKGIMRAYCLYLPKYRYKSGAGVYFEQISDQTIYESVKAFGEKLQFTGQLSFDFIIKKGIPYILECNPRATSGLHLLSKNVMSAFIGEAPYSSQKKEQSKALKFVMFWTNPGFLFSPDFWKSKDVVFSLKDPLPFFLQGIPLLELLYLRIIKGIPFTETMTQDIAFNGHEYSLLR